MFEIEDTFLFIKETIIPTQEGVFLLALALDRSTGIPYWILLHQSELSMSYWKQPKETDLN